MKRWILSGCLLVGLSACGDSSSSLDKVQLPSEGLQACFELKRELFNWQTLADVEVLECSGSDVDSAEGLTQLPHLRYLNLSQTGIEVAAPDLATLYSLGLTENAYLRKVELGKAKDLGKLVLDHNWLLSELDLSANPSLNALYLTGQEVISELDLSNNLELKLLSITEHGLTALDLSPLYRLFGITVLNDGKLEQLTLGTHPDLDNLTAWNNQLTELIFTAPQHIRELNLRQNRLTTLDTEALPVITRLNLSDNPLQSLDLSSNTQLEQLIARDTELTDIRFDNNSALWLVDLRGSPLSEETRAYLSNLDWIAELRYD